jgi:predicted phage gp36 major capsid-like protein
MRKKIVSSIMCTVAHYSEGAARPRTDTYQGIDSTGNLMRVSAVSLAEFSKMGVFTHLQ